MGIDIRLPNITATDTEGKMAQMQSYMHQLVEQLNWALATVDNAIQGNTAGDVLAFAESCPQGFIPFFTGEGSTNVPATGSYQYASGFVCKRSDSQITVVIFSYYSGDLAINTYYDTAGGWLGWRYLKTTTS
jgi:hypothetical protein